MKLLMILFRNSTWRQQINLISVYLLVVINGFIHAWPVAALQILLNPSSPVHISENEIIPISITCLISRLIFATLFSIFMRQMGRKNILSVAALCQALGFCLISIAYHKILLYAALVVWGAALSVSETIPYFYIAEVTTPQIRALSSAFCIFLVSVGLDTQIALVMLDKYFLLWLIPLFLSSVCLIFFRSALESPYILIMKEDEVKAYKNLITLYPEGNINQLLNEIRKYLEEDEESAYTFLSYISNLKNLKICLLFFVITFATSFNTTHAFIAYGPFIMESYSKYMNIKQFMSIFGLMAVFAASVAPFLVHKFSRRSLFIIGFGFIVLVQFTLGFLFSKVREQEQALVVTLIAFLACSSSLIFYATVYPCCHIFMAEIFPQSLKVQGSCLYLYTYTFALILVRGIYFPFVEWIGTSSNFYLYAFVSLGAATCILNQYKETKDLTLTKIRQIYN